MEAKQFIVYILRTSSNTLYIGQTNNLEKRLKEHKEHKRGAKYMRAFDSFELVYTEEFETRSEAMKREYVLKQMTKKEKERLIKEISY
jgi:putative endonuclease